MNCYALISSLKAFMQQQPTESVELRYLIIKQQGLNGHDADKEKTILNNYIYNNNIYKWGDYDCLKQINQLMKPNYEMNKKIVDYYWFEDNLVVTEGILTYTSNK